MEDIKWVEKHDNNLYYIEPFHVMQNYASGSVTQKFLDEKNARFEISCETVFALIH